MACKKRDTDNATDQVAWVQCNECEDWFHQLCVRYAPAASTSNDDDEDLFTCSDCRRSAKLKVFIKETISSEMESLRDDFDGFRAWTNGEITLLSEAVKENREKIQGIMEKGADPATQRRLTSMEEDVLRRDCLQIVTLSGVPVFNDLNDIDIIKKIGQLLGIRIERDDIIRCWRAKVGDPARVPMMYCRFVDLRARNSFFHTWMKHKNVTLDKIKAGCPVTKIYVNEMLSSPAFAVMKKAKQMLKEKKIAAAYSLDGHVLVKKIGANVGRRITTASELEALIVQI
jgi:transcription termination factor NusB